MTNAILYRVERENGDGMYRPSNASDGCAFSEILVEWAESNGCDLSGVCEPHTTPDQDPELAILFWGGHCTHYYFAFASRYQLNRWINRPEWKIKLRARGFAVSIYSVGEGDFVLGDHQAVFVKSSAKLIERVDLMEF